MGQRKSDNMKSVKSNLATTKARLYIWDQNNSLLNTLWGIHKSAKEYTSKMIIIIDFRRKMNKSEPLLNVCLNNITFN